ncbi:MAG TPA: peptide chain release factor 1, partial [Victivallales bacterium]|nr:peptide chain release factor 1 [Victivallales bacterium]
MKSEEIAPLISELELKLEGLKEKISSPDSYSRPSELKSLVRESQRIERILALHHKIISAQKLISDNNLLLSENDPEIIELAKKEIEEAENQIHILEKELMFLLLPQDENDSKDVIIEIRPAAGGDEAGLFASQIFRAYRNYAEKKSWKIQILELSSGAKGGIKEAIFSMSGENVYSLMKYESGVHRVQRVPETEASGRIHTSTITVVVMPEAEEIDIELKASDLKFDVFRSSGPGGQSVNTTDSAVRVTHLPTGISVACQIEKSQHRNKETALRILRSKLLKMKQDEEQAKLSEAKRSQIGSGERSEKIRTYNFPQSRITDHRFNI